MAQPGFHRPGVQVEELVYELYGITKEEQRVIERGI